MGHPAEPLQGRAQSQKAGVNLVAGVHTVGDDAGAHHLVGRGEVHETRGVIQVPDGNVHTPLSEHFIKGGKPLRLLLRSCQVGTVGGGKVAEQTLRPQSRQGGDFRADVRGVLRCLKADAAHARVQGKVEGGNDAGIRGSPGQGHGIFITEDGRTDALTDGLGKGGGRGMAKDQNGIVNSRPAKLQGLQHGADTEEGALAAQQPGDGDSPVAVGIGLDDRHDRNPGFFPDGIDIMGNGIQVDENPGVVKIQSNHLA